MINQSINITSWATETDSYVTQQGYKDELLYETIEETNELNCD